MKLDDTSVVQVPVISSGSILNAALGLVVTPAEEL